MTTFTRTNKSANATSWLITLEGITSARIKELFGQLPRGYGKENKYSEAITVGDPNKPHITLTLYTNYGVWRIGGHSMTNTALELEQYIRGYENL